MHLFLWGQIQHQINLRRNHLLLSILFAPPNQAIFDILNYFLFKAYIADLATLFVQVLPGLKELPSFKKLIVHKQTFINHDASNFRIEVNNLPNQEEIPVAQHSLIYFDLPYFGLLIDNLRILQQHIKDIFFWTLVIKWTNEFKTDTF